MATSHSHAASLGDRNDARSRRWCILALAAAVLLAVYAGGIAWITYRLEASVDRSLQPLPALVLDQPQAQAHP